MLVGRRTVVPILDQALAGTGDGVLVSNVSAIRLSVQALPPTEVSTFSRMRASSAWRALRLPVWSSALSGPALRR